MLSNRVVIATGKVVDVDCSDGVVFWVDRGQNAIFVIPLFVTFLGV
jgi:hypothetical protein